MRPLKVHHCVSTRLAKQFLQSSPEARRLSPAKPSPRDPPALLRRLCFVDASVASWMHPLHIASQTVAGPRASTTVCGS